MFDPCITHQFNPCRPCVCKGFLISGFRVAAIDFAKMGVRCEAMHTARASWPLYLLTKGLYDELRFRHHFQHPD